MLQIFTRRHVKRRPTRRTDSIAADPEDDGRAIYRFGYGNERDQRMNFADPWIVFKPDMKSWMEPIDQRGTHRGSIDLSGYQPDSYGKLLWVIGRPPDSLAFARSDRSSRNKRNIFRLWFLCLCDLFCFVYLWQQNLV